MATQYVEKPVQVNVGSLDLAVSILSLRGWRNLPKLLTSSFEQLFAIFTESSGAKPVQPVISEMDHYLLNIFCYVSVWQLQCIR